MILSFRKRNRGPAETCFTAHYRDRSVCFRRQSAMEQLELPKRAGEVLPLLAGYGLDAREMYALACNCTLLGQVLAGPDAIPGPAGALVRFTLSQIAGLARLYFEHTDESSGGLENHDWDEEGFAGEAFQE